VGKRGTGGGEPLHFENRFDSNSVRLIEFRNSRISNFKFESNPSPTSEFRINYVGTVKCVVVVVALCLGAC
jgi:hypothetical protein